MICSKWRFSRYPFSEVRDLLNYAFAEYQLDTVCGEHVGHQDPVGGWSWMWTAAVPQAYYMSEWGWLRFAILVFTFGFKLILINQIQYFNFLIINVIFDFLITEID